MLDQLPLSLPPTAAFANTCADVPEIASATFWNAGA